MREIASIHDATPMPDAPHYVDGVTNLRGQVTTVTNLRRRFGLPAKEDDDRSRVIVVEPDGVPVGMVVDPGVAMFCGCPRTQISIRSTPKASANWGGGALIILLDLEKLLAAA